MRDLSERMDPCVGAAGSVQFEFTALRDFANRAIDFALNGPRVLLNLPPAIARAGILNQQLESWHRSTYP
jgi:hypothetical protein